MIYEKLLKARSKFLTMEVKKSGHNKFAGYTYFELQDIVPAATKLCDEFKFIGLVSFDVEVAKMTLIDIEDGTQAVITSPMGAANLKGAHEIQNIGACESYQRRYLWLAALDIIEHDALDSTTGHKDNKPGADTIEAMHKAVKYLIVAPDGKMLAEAASAAEAQRKFNEIADKLCKANLSTADKAEKIKSFWAANQKMIDSLSPADKMKMVVTNGDRLNVLNKEAAE
jgi:hypothetical protein